VRFYVEFTNASNYLYKIHFLTYNNSISKKWYCELKNQCEKSNLVYEPDRVYDFSRNHWNEHRVVTELNSCISVINGNNTVIKETAHVGMDQHHLNLLHHYFEKLRGGVLTPGKYWKAASNEQKMSLERYNVLIHRMEALKQRNDQLGPRFVCTFYGYERKKLSTDDYTYFKTTLSAGEAYVNYCEVGKPLYDVFRNGDDIIGDDNIRPLRYYSPDFGVYLTNVKFSDMNEWWNINREKLSKLGFFEHDVTNAIGNIPVARIESKKSIEKIVKELEEFDRIVQVVCHD
jgi:hypothetical protein